MAPNPGLGYVRVHNARGEPVEVLRDPEGASTTNLAFGGRQRSTVYVTDSIHGHVLQARMGTPGMPLARGSR